MIHLSHATDKENCYQLIETNIIISGKQLSPYLIPRKIHIKCSEPKKSCSDLCLNKGEGCEKDLLEDLRIVVKLARTPTEKLQKFFATHLELAKSCHVDITVTEMTAIEQLMIVPDTGYEEKNEHVVRSAYYIGNDSEWNKSYEAEIFTMPDPDSNVAIHIVKNLRPRDRVVDTFRPDSQTMHHIRGIFSPAADTTESYWSKLLEISKQLESITHIYDRPMLTLGVNLVFTSPLHFSLGNEFIKKGYLETLILGDTKTGKGATCEALINYYGVGEVVSGENASFAGLVGGIQQLGNEQRGMLTWGRIVLNNTGLVVIDEISSLALDGILRKLSRIRSEGVSEVDKAGIHARADAFTRLIWISNPKFGAPMREYKFGVLALQELIEANEDISRFDYVLSTLQGEVASDIINTQHIDQRVPRTEARTLLQWIWSRKPKHITFTANARNAVYHYAKEIPKKYSSHIPLVQTETYRIKIAKVAAAIAGMLCITDDSYQELVVNGHAVECAVRFLEETYRSPGLAYDIYSQSKKSFMTKELKALADALPIHIRTVLQNQKHIPYAQIYEWTKGNTEAIDQFIVSGLVTQYGNGYISNLYMKD